MSDPTPGSRPVSAAQTQASPVQSAQAEAFLTALGTEPESEFNDLAELAASICSTPIGLVTLLDEKQQYHKGSIGCSYDSVPRGDTFCDHTVRQDGLFVVKDAQQDARFKSNRLVNREPGIRFYAGTPLYSPSGDKVGALCVIDSIRRELKPWQTRSLTLLAQQCNARLELRLLHKAAEHAFGSAARNDLLFTTFAHSLPFPCYIKDREHRLLFYNCPLAERFGIGEEDWLGLSSYDLWPVGVAERIQAAEEHVFSTGEPSDLRVDLPQTEFRPAVSFILHQRLCRVPAGEPVLGVLALEVAGEPADRG